MNNILKLLYPIQCSTTIPISKPQILENYLIIHGGKSLKHLKQAHARLFRLHLSQHDGFISTILDNSFHLGNIHYAYGIFNHTRRPTIFLFNTMIRGLVSADLFHESITYFHSMRSYDYLPNRFTFPSLLKACGRVSDYKLGLTMHSLIFKLNLDDNEYVSNTLVYMYAGCGDIVYAHKVFDEMPLKSVVSWTAIMSGYINAGQFHQAVDLFKIFLDLGLRPDSFALVRLLSACAELRELEIGECLHRYVDQIGIRKDFTVNTKLIDMYAKCGCMEKAVRVFDQMQDKDVISWTTLIQGYVLNDLPTQALEVYSQMEREGVEPDRWAFLAVLEACSRLGAIGLGEQKIRSIEKSKFASDPVLRTAIMDMHAKCGDIELAWTAFRETKERDIVVWNAIISTLSTNGYVNIAFAVFAQMEKLGVQCNGTTIIGLLSGCAHAGLVDEGRKLFNAMECIFSVTPTIEHYGCMVDLLSRAGLLEEARQLVKIMPMEPNEIVWGALLGGCRLYRNTLLGEFVVEQLVQLQPLNPGYYVLLSNMYAANNKWHDAERTRERMRMQGLRKMPGCSVIEVDGIAHEFVAGDYSHPMADEIYAKLEDLLKDSRAAGYLPAKEFALFDLEEEEKDHLLRYHSEKLAIAYALITTPAHHVIRVVKNLRICGDCHAAIKMFSQITGRKIVVRDIARFHHFVDGSCSCRDYW